MTYVQQQAPRPMPMSAPQSPCCGAPAQAQGPPGFRWGSPSLLNNYSAPAQAQAQSYNRPMQVSAKTTCVANNGPMSFFYTSKAVDMTK